MFGNAVGIVKLRGRRDATTITLDGALLAGIVVLAVAVAGCGGNGAHSAAGVARIGTTTTTTAPVGGPPASGAPRSLIQFTRCMRAHGVPDFPMPQVNGKSVTIRLQPVSKSAPRFDAALQACRYILPPAGSAQPISVAGQRDYLKAAQCMRERGFADFPDPVFSGGTVHFSLPADVNRNNPKAEAAVTACRKLIPAGFAYSGGGS